MGEFIDQIVFIDNEWASPWNYNFNEIDVETVGNSCKITEKTIICVMSSEHIKDNLCSFAVKKTSQQTIFILDDSRRDVLDVEKCV